MIKLNNAMLCMDCEYIYDMGEAGRGPYVCPVCGSQYSYNVAKFLNRKETSTDKEKI